MARRPGKQRRAGVPPLPKSRKTRTFDNALPAKAAEAWEKASAAEKEAALEKARRYVSDHFSFRGEKKAPHQDGAWPRVNAFYDDGKPIERVPDEVQRATALTATFFAAGIPINAAARPHIFALLGPVLAPENLP